MGGPTRHEVGRRSRIGNRRRAVASVVAVVLVPILLAGCTKPPRRPHPTTTTSTTASTTTTSTTTTTTVPDDCRALDFDRAAVSGDVLLVDGHKPSIDQEIRLESATYVQQPDYWQIDVLVCNPPATDLPADKKYSVTRDIGNAIGTRGIVVQGATTSQRIDVARVTTNSCFNGGATITLTTQQAEVRAGDRISIGVVARHASPSGRGGIGGGGILSIPRPPLVQRDGEVGGERISVRLSSSGPDARGVQARGSVTATVAPEAEPGDVIEWRAPTYEFDFDTYEIDGAAGTTATIRVVRHIVCTPRDPNAVVIRQTVVL